MNKTQSRKALNNGEVLTVKTRDGQHDISLTYNAVERGLPRYQIFRYHTGIGMKMESHYSYFSTFSEAFNFMIPELKNNKNLMEH